MERTYAQTLSKLLDVIPDSVQITPDLEASLLSQASVPHDGRRFARRKMIGDMLCQFRGTLPAFPRPSSLSKVISLDISRGGIRFLSDKQMYPEEELVLWTPIGQIPCKVARCLKHDEACFEMGVEIRK